MTNVTGAVTSTNGGTGNTATAVLSVTISSVPISPRGLLLIAIGLSIIAFWQFRRGKRTVVNER
jgi:hypothetical protein